jgi:hypothetical protein
MERKLSVIGNPVKRCDFRRWAVVGVVAPFVALLVLRFAIAPILWPDLAVELGSRLGFFFMLYLLLLACGATVRSIARSPRESPISIPIPISIWITDHFPDP